MTKNLKIEMEDFKERLKRLAEKHCYDVSHDLFILDEMATRIKLLENSLHIYKTENDKYEKSTHIDDFLYEFKVNENNEISCLITANGIEHSFGISEECANDFAWLFKQHSKKNKMEQLHLS